MSMFEFVKAQAARRYEQVPRKVLAFYYTWYGNPDVQGKWIHWRDVNPVKHDIATSRHYPVKGAYDSHDPAIIAHHIDLAKQCGIDGFIATWWNQGDIHDKAMPLVLDAAAKRQFDVTIYWETVKKGDAPSIDKGVADMVYVLRKYGAHPAFLKVDGKPVIFVYGRVMNEVKAAQWPELVARVRQEYGKDFLLIADGYKDVYAMMFDGIHTYNIARPVSGKTPDEIRAMAKTSFASAVSLAKSRGRVSCLTIIPGYDDTKNRTPGLKAERHDGKTYEILWEEAIAADPDWILITSWNEWHEGSDIEPSLELGDKYIEITGKYAPQFKQRPFSQVKAAPAASAFTAEQAKALRELYGGKKIGILSGSQGAALFALSDAGVAMVELDWSELLDAARFNARAFPIVVNAGAEAYTQTVKTPGDVDEALLRYLREGGLLLSMTSLPLPFYKNEKAESVGAARKFGLPVVGPGGSGAVKGWEKPPEGATLTFAIDGAVLPGLPATAAFPPDGDQRWRPCNREWVAAGDVYLSGARLVDDKGAYCGDGVAYIEHKESEPKGGKAIYVWMRMSDILPARDLAFAVFRLAAEKARAK